MYGRAHKKSGSLGGALVLKKYLLWSLLHFSRLILSFSVSFSAYLIVVHYTVHTLYMYECMNVYFQGEF